MSPPTWAVPIRIVDDEARQARDQRAEERQQHDLAAQQGMDEATRKMAEWAVHQTIIVGIGTMLLVLTLWVSAQANRSASLAASAAVSMNELTEALERPLVGIKMTEEAIEFDERWQFKDPVKFHIANMGRTPAKITAIQRRWFVSDRGQHPPIIDPDDGMPAKAAHRYVAGNSVTEGIWAGTKDSWPAQPHPPKLIFFHGWIRFEDMKGKKFLAGFSYFINPVGDRIFAMAWPSRDADKYNYCRQDD